MKETFQYILKSRPHRIFLIVLITFVGFSTLSSCATKKAYSGPDLPDDKIAIIRPDINKAFTEIKILSIDGYKLNFYESEVAVWPGNHKLSIEVKTAFPYFNDALAFSQNISFNVEEGYTYTIQATIDSVKQEGFLEVTSDKESNQYVGGAKIGPVKLLTKTH
jgi:hypothetical protein